LSFNQAVGPSQVSRGGICSDGQRSQRFARFNGVKQPSPRNFSTNSKNGTLFADTGNKFWSGIRLIRGKDKRLVDSGQYFGLAVKGDDSANGDSGRLDVNDGQARHIHYSASLQGIQLRQHQSQQDGD
jgi:hypothetical protein